MPVAFPPNAGNQDEAVIVAGGRVANPTIGRRLEIRRCNNPFHCSRHRPLWSTPWTFTFCSPSCPSIVAASSSRWIDTQQFALVFRPGPDLVWVVVPVSRRRLLPATPGRANTSGQQQRLRQDGGRASIPATRPVSPPKRSPPHVREMCPAGHPSGPETGTTTQRYRPPLRPGSASAVTRLRDCQLPLGGQ